MGEVVKSNDPAQVAQFSALFEGTRIQALIADAQAQVGSMTVGTHTFPYSVSGPTQTANCYLCSPSTAYIDYARAEVNALQMSNAAKSTMMVIIKALAPLVRATGLDAQMQVNNWMVSTNPLPDLSLDLIDGLKNACLGMQPARAIVIRSANDLWDGQSIKALKAAGFKLLAARQIYLLPKDSVRWSRDVKRDAKMLAQTSFERVEGDAFSDAEFEQCATLYRALYLDKYTALNPHYTALFLQRLQSRGVMKMVALRDPVDGIVGFTGLFESAGVLTQPFVGYDTQRPQAQGIYRMLMHIGRARAQAQNLDYNMSAGAAQFKRNRGGVASIEYTAVYVAHRPWTMRAAVAILQFVTCRIGVPLVRKAET